MKQLSKERLARIEKSKARIIFKCMKNGWTIEMAIKGVKMIDKHGVERPMTVEDAERLLKTWYPFVYRSD